MYILNCTKPNVFLAVHKTHLKNLCNFSSKSEKRDLNMDRTKNESEFARFHQQSMENDGKSGFDEDLQRYTSGPVCYKTRHNLFLVWMWHKHFMNTWRSNHASTITCFFCGNTLGEKIDIKNTLQKSAVWLLLFSQLQNVEHLFCFVFKMLHKCPQKLSNFSLHKCPLKYLWNITTLKGLTPYLLAQGWPASGNVI